MQQLEAELTELTQVQHTQMRYASTCCVFSLSFILCPQVCETQVRAVGLELLSSLQEVNLRLNYLKDRMEQLDHEELVSLQVLELLLGSGFGSLLLLKFQET